MKLIDTSLFADSYEATVLWVKLNLEYRGVQKWIIIENDYSLRGAYKGHHLNKLLRDDKRFDLFKEQITVMEMSEQYIAPDPFNDDFTIEIKQRNLPFDYIVDHYADDYWVKVSDVDEALDFEEPYRFSEILGEYLNYNRESFAFQLLRYWYDFDNGVYYRHSHRSATVGTLKKYGSIVGATNNSNTQMINFSRPVAFEYSFCFSRDGLWKKLNTFSHPGYTEEDLESALKCNHWVKASRRQESDNNREYNLADPMNWFGTVDLTPLNSPEFVRNNLKELKTYIVDKNYKENRERLFPQFFKG